jgi:hypothetical protein
VNKCKAERLSIGIYMSRGFVSNILVNGYSLATNVPFVSVDNCSTRNITRDLPPDAIAVRQSSSKVGKIVTSSGIWIFSGFCTLEVACCALAVP